MYLDHIITRAAVPLVPEGQTLDTIGTVSLPVCDIDSSVRGGLAISKEPSSLTYRV